MEKNRKIISIIGAVIIIASILYFTKADINHGNGLTNNGEKNIETQSTH